MPEGRGRGPTRGSERSSNALLAGPGSPRYDNQCSSYPDKGGSLEEPGATSLRPAASGFARPQISPEFIKGEGPRQGKAAAAAGGREARPGGPLGFHQQPRGCRRGQGSPGCKG